MPVLVKVFRDDDGDRVLFPVWHLDDPEAPGVWGQVFCTGEVYGEAESDVVYERKITKRGGIECERCMEKLRAYKRVKL